MSATGRNLAGHERNALDFYETPGWCTRAILPFLGAPKTLLDAGAGTGAILRECVRRWGPNGFEQKGIERSHDLIGRAMNADPKLDVSGLIAQGDFFKIDRDFDLVISNPPYADAESFAIRALQLGKTVCFLLRLNWLASQKRAAFHREHPADIYVLPRRPSFTNGGTDATEYAWFVWGDARAYAQNLVNVNLGVVRILDLEE